MDVADARALRDRCTRFLGGHGRQSAADLLAEIPTHTEADRYGDGGVVAALEERVAALLGQSAAVFFPSGTMAQQVALRIHADQRSARTVVMHPTAHLLLHELQAAERLHGLTCRPIGPADEPLTAEALGGVAEPVAALLVELPQREIGGSLPDLDELDAQLRWARSRGAAAHLDGARLWEAATGYGREVGEIGARFDTVYVSFYKGIGALPGCCLAGPDDVVAQAREWRRRMGGTLFALWPNAASAMVNLDRRLPRLPSYLDHARAIAAVLATVEGVTVVPDPPPTSMMHLLLRTGAESLEARARQLAEQDGLWTWPGGTPTLDPAVQRVELSVGDATLEWRPDEAAELIERLCLPTS